LSTWPWSCSPLSNPARAAHRDDCSASQIPASKPTGRVTAMCSDLATIRPRLVTAGSDLASTDCRVALTRFGDADRSPALTSQASQACRRRRARLADPTDETDLSYQDLTRAARPSDRGGYAGTIRPLFKARPRRSQVRPDPLSGLLLIRLVANQNHC
jgi:hypothetical protein